MSDIFSKNLAIDMGSCYTRIIIADKGLVLCEPTVLAKDKYSHEIVAIGKEAEELEGKEPQCIEIIRPIKNGTIFNFDAACALLKRFIRSVCDKSIIKPRVIITVPCLLTDVEKHAVIDMVTLAGARRTYLIESTLAASIGAKCDVTLPRGMFTVNIGGERCDISSISSKQAVHSYSIKTGGNSFTEDTIRYIREKYNLNIGRATAQNLKEDIGGVYTLDRPQSRKVYGTDVTTGLPRSVTVTSDELKDAYENTLNIITTSLKIALEDTPPELLGDIIEDGILLTGGCSLLFGMERRIRMSLGIKVYVAENVDMCAAFGAGYELNKLGESSVLSNAAALINR